MTEDTFISGLRRIFEENTDLKPATVSADAGLDKSAIRMLFEGRTKSPKLSTALAISKSIGMSLEDITAIGQNYDLSAKVGDLAYQLELKSSKIENGHPAPDGANLVPVYSVAASAGFGSVVEHEDQIYNLAFDNRFLRQMTTASSGDLAIISVKGTSMEPTLLDDDLVLVDRSKRNLSYDGLFVIRFDDALHIKRISRSTKRGHVLVISDNKSYPTLDMAKDQLDPVGRVLWCGRKV